MNIIPLASGWLRGCSGSIIGDISTSSGAWLLIPHQILILGAFKIAFLGFWPSLCRILARNSDFARDLQFPINFVASSFLGTYSFHHFASKSPFLGINHPNWDTYNFQAYHTAAGTLQYLYVPLLLQYTYYNSTYKHKKCEIKIYINSQNNLSKSEII